MSKRWYYSLGGAQYGPVEEIALVQLINSGDLPPGTPVLKEGSKDWSAARNHVCLTGKKKSTLKPIPKPATAESHKTDKPRTSTPHDDEKFYEQVATELGDDSRKQGLWLKAETKAQGDIDRARLLYAEWRVGQMVEKEREKQRKEEEGHLAKKKVEREREREATQKKEDLARRMAQQQVEEDQKLLAKETVERERTARQEKEVSAKKIAQQRIEDEAKLKAVVKTLEKATACITPLSRFGYKVVSSKLTQGKPFWEIVDPHLQKSVNVPQDRLVRYVRQQITLYSYIVNCPRCDTPLEEVRKAVWECPEC